MTDRDVVESYEFGKINYLDELFRGEIEPTKNLELVLGKLIPRAQEISKVLPKDELRILVSHLRAFYTRRKSKNAELLLNNLGYPIKSYPFEELSEKNAKHICAGLIFIYGLGLTYLGLTAEKLNPDIGWFKNYLVSVGILLTAAPVIPIIKELKPKIYDFVYDFNEYVYTSGLPLR